MGRDGVWLGLYFSHVGLFTFTWSGFTSLGRGTTPFSLASVRLLASTTATSVYYCFPYRPPRRQHAEPLGRPSRSAPCPARVGGEEVYCWCVVVLRRAPWCFLGGFFLVLVQMEMGGGDGGFVCLRLCVS
jgi:hypothetical protein